jgi:glycogen debranching enzyme
VHNYSAAAKKHIREKSKTLEDHFYNHEGLFCISEIFDGELPSAGKGCIQQAWSLGMTLKALLETE